MSLAIVSVEKINLFLETNVIPDEFQETNGLIII